MTFNDLNWIKFHYDEATYDFFGSHVTPTRKVGRLHIIDHAVIEEGQDIYAPIIAALDAKYKKTDDFEGEEFIAVHNVEVLDCKDKTLLEKYKLERISYISYLSGLMSRIAYEQTNEPEELNLGESGSSDGTLPEVEDQQLASEESV